MSYVLHIWEHPVPLTFDEATHAALELGGDAVGQTPGFLVLAGRLKARFPCLMDDDEAVWSDGPLDGVTDERALVLGIGQRHDEVIAFVVACAARLNLAVFDMQQAKAWLPDGRLMGPCTGQAPAPAPWSELIDPGEVEGTVLAGLLRSMRLHGFRYEKTGGNQALAVDFPGGCISLIAVISNYQPVCHVQLLISFTLDSVSRIASAFYDNPYGAAPRPSTATIRYGDLDGVADPPFAVQSRHELAAAIIAMSQRLHAEVLPILARCTEAGGLDAVWNGSPQGRLFNFGPGERMLARLTAARLAGNPAFEDIAKGIMSAIHVRRYPEKRKIMRLMEYLRHTDPAAPLAPPASRYADLDSFIERYDGTQFALIACDSNGQTGDDFADANQQFRYAIVKIGQPTMDRFSLRLLRDLFRASAEEYRAKRRYQGCWDLAALARALLARGGAGELDLFAESVLPAALDVPHFQEMDAGGDMPLSLASVCDERSENPLYASKAAHYQALGHFFRKMMARRQ